jgi:glyoxylase-like metal-dependent hydrolase (beta-lactamase superfamily II)
LISAEERPFYDRIAAMIPPAAPVHVDRLLHGGDDLGWERTTEVIEVPGHTPGSIAVYLPDELVLLTGDNVASFEERRSSVHSTLPDKKRSSRSDDLSRWMPRLHASDTAIRSSATRTGRY